jgi:hypothetical protein
LKNENAAASFLRFQRSLVISTTQLVAGGAAESRIGNRGHLDAGGETG